jgi:acyl-CoA synthetase (NDP forming)
MRLIGPNCLGIMNPAIGLNATFAKDAPKGRQRCFPKPERGAPDGNS